jgi:hypothetical protein
MKMIVKRNKYLIIVSVLLLALVIALAIGLSSAKYKTEKHQNAGIKMTVSLAEKIQIQEHEAERQNDGSYVLKEDLVEEQAYVLMPGVDVPKDPYITVLGKTELPGWLFVEVVESADFPAEVEYSVDDANWDKIEGLTGDNDGQIYVYKTILTSENTTDTTTFSILKDNQLIVSDRLSRLATAELTFYGYLCQQVSDDAKADFERIFGTASAETDVPSVTPQG